MYRESLFSLFATKQDVLGGYEQRDAQIRAGDT